MWNAWTAPPGALPQDYDADELARRQLPRAVPRGIYMGGSKEKFYKDAFQEREDTNHDTDHRTR
jgi:hypothetical protein